MPILLLITTCLLPSTYSQSQGAEKSRVYVIARRVDGSPDLGAEKKLKEEFRKRKTITVANSSGDADLIFLAIVEYDNYQGGSGIVTGGTGSVIGYSETYIKTALGLALLPGDWSGSKNDLEALREKAVWQDDISVGKLKRASLSKLVTSFIERRIQIKSD